MSYVRTVLVTLALAASAAQVVVAQSPGGNLGAQNLRPYWHVFAAYAIAWLLIAWWVLSIARRLGKLEKRTES